LCRAHIRAFAKSAEKYAAETQLSKRVGDWQSRLLPILDEEEERPEFDIREYGAHILKTLEQEVTSRNIARKTSLQSSDRPTNVVNFQFITKDSEPYEVCRLFLSSLMLCNTGNIVLSNEEGSMPPPAALKMEFLNPILALAMETYKAPSEAERSTHVINCS